MVVTPLISLKQRRDPPEAQAIPLFRKVMLAPGGMDMGPRGGGAADPMVGALFPTYVWYGVATGIFEDGVVRKSTGGGFSDGVACVSEKAPVDVFPDP